jgi:hypothetical protein
VDSFEFTLNGERYSLSRKMVVQAMKNQIPGRIQTYAVDIDGVQFPVKQVLAQSIRVPVTSFVSTRAQDLLAKLDFKVVNVEEGPDASPDIDLRALALGLAVELYAQQGADVDVVLGAAARFEVWMDR